MRRGSLLLVVAWLTLAAGDHASPRIAADIGAPLVFGVTVEGYHTYLLDVEGVSVYDTQNPFSPKHLGKISFDATSHTGAMAATRTGFVFVPAFGGTTTILDFRDKKSPKLHREDVLIESSPFQNFYALLKIDALEDLLCLYMVGGVALVRFNPAAAGSDMLVFESNIDDGSSIPKEFGVRDGSRVFLGTSDKIITYDVSDPKNPREVASFTITGLKGLGAAVLGGKVVARRENTLSIIDVDAELVVGSVEVPSTSANNNAFDSCFIEADTSTRAIFLMCEGGVAVIDARVLSHPRVVDTFPAALFFTWGVGPGYAVVLEVAHALVLAPFTSEPTPLPLGKGVVGRAMVPEDYEYDRITAAFGAVANGATEKKKYVYVAGRATETGMSRMDVIDVSDPKSPKPVGKLIFREWVMDLAIRGEEVFIARADVTTSFNDPGVQVVDVSNKHLPVMRKDFDTLAANQFFAPSFIAAASDTTVLLTSPTRSIVDEWDTRTEVKQASVAHGSFNSRNDIALSEGIVYLRASSAVLAYDATSITAGEKGRVEPLNFGNTIAAAGGLVVTDDFPTTLLIIEWSTKSVLHSVDVGGPVRGLDAVVDGVRTVVYAVGDHWLKAFEVCNTGAGDDGKLWLLGTEGLASLHPSVSLLDGYAYVADGYDGMKVLKFPETHCGEQRPPAPAPVPPLAGRPFAPGGCAFVRAVGAGMFPCYPVTIPSQSASTPTSRSTDGHLFLHSIPQALAGARGVTAWFPPLPLKQGTEVQVRCGCGRDPRDPSKEGCSVVVAVYHCLPCSRGKDGGYPAALPGLGFKASTACAPQFSLKDKNVDGWEDERHRMVTFQKNLKPTETLTLPAATFDADHVVVFTTAAPLPDGWCPSVPKDARWVGPSPNRCYSRFC